MTHELTEEQRLMVELGWESYLSEQSLSEASTPALRKLLVLLAQPDDNPRDAYLSRLAERLTREELARRGES